MPFGAAHTHIAHIREYPPPPNDFLRIFTDYHQLSSTIMRRLTKALEKMYDLSADLEAVKTMCLNLGQRSSVTEFWVISALYKITFKLMET